MKHCGDVDVVVVGGGHAGCEAAHAAWRLGAKTLLVTQKIEGIGALSCNPAIGGIGKGHIVREIDALDGLMARVADRSGIQFRLLNRSKGPASQGPRTQADRDLYRHAMQAALAAATGLKVLVGEVIDLDIRANAPVNVLLAAGTTIHCRAVVLTTGTFLRGVIHIGHEQHAAGRLGDRSSTRLAERIDDLGLPLGRLKTGTPPRLDGRTIDWGRLGLQHADEDATMFSFLSERPTARQVACGVTETNERTHSVIRANLGASALCGGGIRGVGPRYCPSIEDKILRFPEKGTHRVILEPEGLSTDAVYPNGISTSLPPSIQETFIRTMEGLENAALLQPGYAVEYDYVDPRALDSRLALKVAPSLFLAGQINGTTGYEEAAGQGLVAGLNAAAWVLEREPVVFDRSTAYIGVMIDDLVTNGASEPYRMFTSRAEYRLELRADNADRRLTPLGLRIGVVSARRRRSFERKMVAIQRVKVVAQRIKATPKHADALGLRMSADGVQRTLEDLLGAEGLTVQMLASHVPEFRDAPSEAVQQVVNDALYAPYLARQTLDIARLRRDEAVELPSDLDYEAMPGLSRELREKLGRVQPRTLAQAGRIEGMTPAALTMLLLRLRAGTALGKPR